MTDVAIALPLPDLVPQASPDAPWLAVWTKPRAEKVASAFLGACDIPVWLPIVTTRRRWSDRWKNVDMPLFPGYFFAQPTASEWARVLRVPGVLTVVKHGRRPAWIRPVEIVDLKRAVDRVANGEQEAQVVPEFFVGDRVRVVNGPMAGLVGIAREIRGSRRLLVGIEHIGRSLSISIEAADVEHYDG